MDLNKLTLKSQAALQEAQQRAVIAQLLKESEVLRPEQRAALAELLLAQPARTPTRH